MSKSTAENVQRRPVQEFPHRRLRVPSDPRHQGGTLGKSTAQNVGGVIVSALGTAWREATEPANESSPKR